MHVCVFEHANTQKLFFTCVFEHADTQELFCTCLFEHANTQELCCMCVFEHANTQKLFCTCVFEHANTRELFSVRWSLKWDCFPKVVGVQSRSQTGFERVLPTSPPRIHFRNANFLILFSWFVSSGPSESPCQYLCL